MEKRVISVLLSVILLVSLIGFVSASIWTSNLNDGLVNYWGFTESSGINLREFSDSNNGTLTGTQNWTKGLKNNAFNFDGSSYFTLNHASLQGGINELTVLCWEKTSYTGDQCLFGMNEYPSANFFLCQFGSNSGKIEIGVAGAYGIDANISTNDGNWHLVGGTKDSSNNWQPYVDGSESGTAVTHSSLAFTTSIGSIGKSLSGTGGGNFQGQLGQCIVWNRTLNSSEINTLYNNGNAITPWTSNLNRGLLSSYNFDEGSGSKIIDLNNGTRNMSAYQGTLNWNGSTSISGDSLHLDVSNQASNQNFYFNETSPWSFSFWFYRNSDAGQTQFIGSYPSGSVFGAFTGITFYDQDTGPRRVFASYLCSDDSSANWGPLGCIQQETNYTLPVQQWVHVVSTYDGSKTRAGVKVYFNGAETTYDNAIGLDGLSGTFTKTGIILGGGETGGGYHDDYLIDDLNVWSRVIDSDEANQLYNNGSSLIFTHFNISGPTPQINYTWQDNLNNGLVSYWGFTESSGTNLGELADTNNGSLTGNQNWTSGLTNNAFNFDGSSYFTLSNFHNLSSGDLSLFCWVKYTTSSAICPFGISEFSNSNFFLCSFGGTIEFGTANGFTSDAGVSTNDGNWHLVGGEYSAGTYQAYVDGSASGVSHTGSTVNITDSSGSIGKSLSGTGGGNFIGEIGQCVVWNRTLNNSEVTQLYNNGNGITFTPEVQNETEIILSPGFINTCGNITSPGVYTLNSSIFGDDTCITIDSDNVVLNGAGYTMTYNEDSSSLQHGVLISNYHKNITIENFADIRNFDEINSGDNNGIMVRDGLGYSSITNNTIHSFGDYDGDGGGANCITFTQGGFYGFSATTNDTYNNITYNNCSSHSEGFTWYSGLSSHNIILGNNITSVHQGLDIYVTSFENNIIKNNNVRTPETGIVTYFLTSNNIFDNNNIDSGDSIQFQQISHNDIISNNNLTSVGFDFLIGGTSDNLTLLDQRIASYNFYGLPINITFENSTYGKITLFGASGSDTDLFADITIDFNRAFVDSDTAGLNVTGNVTLFNLPTNFTNPKIFVDGNRPCNSTSNPSCFNFTSLNNGNVSFNVSSWSYYSIVGTSTPTTPPSSPNVFSPDGTYNVTDFIPINYTQSTSNNTIVNYSIFLLNSDYSTNSTIVANNFLNLSYLWKPDFIGSFYAEVIVCDNTGLCSNGTSELFFITKSSSNCQVLFNSTVGLAYPNNFSVYSDCNSPFTLYRNGIIISNNSLQSLGAGTYNFTVQRTDTQNYSNIGQERDFNLLKSSSSCQVLFNTTSPQTYPYVFNVFTNCDTSFTLYRDGTPISNSSDQNLNGGTYVFTVQRTDTQNYSNVFDSQTFIISQQGVVTTGGGGGGTPEGWVVLSTNQTVITLNSIDTISGTQWYYDSDNIIEVMARDSNGSLVDVDNITLREMNNQPFSYSVVRNDTGSYEVHFRVTDTNVKNLNFELTIQQGSKTLSKTIGFGDVASQYVSGLTGRAIALGNNIYNWSAQNMFFLFIVVAIFGIVIVLYFVIRVMTK